MVSGRPWRGSPLTFRSSSMARSFRRSSSIVASLWLSPHGSFPWGPATSVPTGCLKEFCRGFPSSWLFLRISYSVFSCRHRIQKQTWGQKRPGSEPCVGSWRPAPCRTHRLGLAHPSPYLALMTSQTPCFCFGVSVHNLQAAFPPFQRTCLGPDLSHMSMASRLPSLGLTCLRHTAEVSLGIWTRGCYKAPSCSITAVLKIPYLITQSRKVSGIQNRRVKGHACAQSTQAYKPVLSEGAVRL